MAMELNLVRRMGTLSCETGPEEVDEAEDEIRLKPEDTKREAAAAASGA